MEYEEPRHLDHGAASVVLEQALEGIVARPHPNSVLVGLALFDEDRAYVEDWCIRLGNTAPDLALRGLASLCVGHLARRFGTVSDEAAAVVRRLAHDDAVRQANPQVLDGLDDLKRFTE